MSAENDFEKHFFKLLNNAVFGKTMENVRKHREMCTKWDGRFGARKYIANPYFQTSKIFNESCATIELQKSKCLLDKPISIGMAILDISKCLMYDFHYGHMKQIYRNDV